LLSMDLAKMDLNAGGPPRGATERPDNDYAVAWVRNYGRGRVFYSTMAHNPYVFWNTNLLRFYLNAIQFALGDLPAPTTPSARLTPAVRAQESLGWRLAVVANTFPKQTFTQTIENATQLGVPFIGGCSSQKVSADLSKNFDADLTDQELDQVRLKLESAGLRLLTCSLDDLPADAQACRRVFEFGRKMGIETFVCAPEPNALDVVEKLANEYGINVALNPRAQDGRFKVRNLTSTLKQCVQRSRRIGVYGDMDTWLQHGIDPVKAVRNLGDRLLVLQIHDLDGKSRSSHEVPWGTGVGQVEKVIRELQRLRLKPTMIGALVPPDSASLSPVRDSIEFFNRTTLNLLPVGNRLP
jgi:sugar phosphate isomerase/epimerase